MDTKSRKTIALVDWHWMGHHPTYYRKFMSALHGLRCDILPVCPLVANEEVDSWAREFPGEAVVHPPIHAKAPRRRQRLVARSLKDVEQALTCFGRLGRQLRAWEKACQKAIDLVFFPTIYDSEFMDFTRAEWLFRFPWSGLYLHARAFRMPGTPIPYTDIIPRPESIFTSPRLSSVCLLDEGAVRSVQQLAPGKPVFPFPDVTDVAVGSNEHSLAQKARQFAAGKKIVVCLGHLQRTKGILELCHAVRDASLQHLLFVFAGEVYWKGMNEAEQRFIRETWETAPNVFTHLARMDDQVMNELIRASDMVFAAYTDFPNSSNVMTKAAYFQKPVLVSDGYLMAERVRQFRLGAIVPEGSFPDIVREIRLLCDAGNDIGADYQGYWSKHSMDALAAAFSRVIEAIPA